MRNFWAVLAIFAVCAQAESRALHRFDTESRVESLLSQMTLDEKIRLMGGNGMDGFSIGRLGIPSWHMSDGPVGLSNSQGQAVGTAFPAGVAMAASWDPAAVEGMTQSLGAEGRSIGKNVLLGPCVNIHRLPAGGRNAESFSEDPFLAARMTESYIRGVQNGGMLSVVKHFALNNQEQDRLQLDVHSTRRAMEEIYLPAFHAAVEAGTWGVMAAYNKVNGVYASENTVLLNDILKKEWAFAGFVMSDWGATFASDTLTAAWAGLDIEMPQAYVFYPDKIRSALSSGSMTEELVNDKVRRQLRAMIEMGFIGAPISPLATPPVDRLQASQAAAARVATESVVLLKNRDHILPLDISKAAKVLLVGPNAANVPTGVGGSSLAGLNQKLAVETALHQRWPLASLHTDDGSDLKRAADLARDADVVLAFMGWNPSLEGEGVDRSVLHLPTAQENLLVALTVVNPHVIVVVNSGSSFVSRPWIDDAAGLLASWYLGQNAVSSVLDVLDGTVNPSGHLPDSFLRADVDTWAQSRESGQAIEYDEGIFVGYRSLDKRNVETEFPFGFGLSYTQFELSNAHLESGADGSVDVFIDVKNTGDRMGAEVVQVYAHPLASKVDRPPQELKAFARVEIAAGQSQTVKLHLAADSFRYYDESQGWVDDNGGFELRVGVSSRDIRSVLTR